MATTYYATIEEIKDFIGVNTAVTDGMLAVIRDAASRTVDDFCGQQFYQNDSATARVFTAGDGRYLNLWQGRRAQPISTSTGLVVKTDDDEDGTYETTWAAGDYLLEPLDRPDSAEPAYGLRVTAAGNYLFPARTPGGVQVTARWGWPVVPDAVKQATLVIAANMMVGRGVSAQVGAEFGLVPGGASRFVPPGAEALLRPYMRNVYGVLI